MGPKVVHGRGPGALSLTHADTHKEREIKGLSLSLSLACCSTGPMLSHRLSSTYCAGATRQRVVLASSVTAGDKLLLLLLLLLLSNFSESCFHSKLFSSDVSGSEPTKGGRGGGLTCLSVHIPEGIEIMSLSASEIKNQKLSSCGVKDKAIVCNKLLGSD